MEKRIREIISENSGVTGVLLRDSVGKTTSTNWRTERMPEVS